MIFPSFVQLLFTIGAYFIVDRIFAPSSPVIDQRDDGTQQRSRANPLHTLNPLYGNWHTYGQDIYLGASADNTRGYYAIALGLIPEGASITFTEVIIDDITVTLNANGLVTAGVDPNGVAVDRYNGLIQIERYAGGRSTFLENAVTDWDSTFIADRVAYAVVQLDRDREAGVVQLPQIRFVGVSSSNNPADAVQDMLTDARYGLGKSMDLIGDTFEEHRVYCNAQVAHLDRMGNTVMSPRFTVSGAIDASQNIRDRCNEILSHQNATLGWRNGKYEIYANKEQSATTTNIDDTWFIGGVEFGETAANLFTQLEIEHRSNVDNHYRENTFYLDVPTTLQKPAQQPRLDNISFPYCDDQVQARRVGAWIINEAFTSLIIRATLDIRGIQLEPQQVVRITSEKYNFTNKQFQVREIDEIQRGSELTYRVTFREYEPTNYPDDGTIQEQDPAPNLDFVEPGIIPAVSNLAVANPMEGAEVPNFDLTWTIPTGALIDEFDIFIGTSSTFTDSMLLRRVIPAGRNFIPGTGFTENITGVTTGTYFFWVVGRNSFGSSGESNAATLTWNPQAEAGVRAVRHHDNPVTMTPMDPGGMDGTDNGWYDPIEGTTITTNRPDDPDPHWEATGIGIDIGANEREVAFDFAGQGAILTVTETPQFQEHNLVVSGTPGQRGVQTPAAQEVTQFDFTGTTSTSLTNPGIPEIWDISVAGRSDAASAATNEEFFIHLDGTTNTLPDVPQQSFIYTTGNSNTRDPITQQFYLYLTGSTPSESSVDLGETYVIGNFNIQNRGTIRLFRIFDNRTEDVTNPTLADRFSITARTTDDIDTLARLFNVEVPTVSGGTSAPSVFLDYQLTVSGTDSDNNPFSFTMSFSGFSTIRVTRSTDGDSVAFFVRSTTFSDTTPNVDLERIDVSISALEPRANVGIRTNPSTGGGFTTGRFPISRDLSGSTALRDNLLPQIQANTAITSDYTVEAGTASGISGIADGEPIITFTAMDDIDRELVEDNNFIPTTLMISSGELREPFEPTSSTVQVQIPSVFVNRLFTLPDDLTTDTALRDSLLTSLQTESRITSNFTLEAVVSDSTHTGVPVGSPIILLTSDDADDHPLTVTFTNGSGDLTGSTSGISRAAVDNMESSVTVQIPTESINVTFTLPDNLSGSTALRDSLLTLLQGSTDITNEFTVTSGTADAATTGVTVGEPIVLLTANDNTDHSISVSFDNGSDGNLTPNFGSHVEGDVADVSTEIRITYDEDIPPSMQDIVFGGTSGRSETAQVLATMINSHARLSAEIVPVTPENLFQGELSDLDLAYEGNEPSFSLGHFAFTDDQTQTSASAARDDVMALPSTRPASGSLVVQYSAQDLDVFAAEVELAFPGVYTPGSTLFRTDVSRFNRRLLVETTNFSASYAIDRFAASSDSRNQFFILSDGRAPNTEEQALINAVPTNASRP